MLRRKKSDGSEEIIEDLAAEPEAAAEEETAEPEEEPEPVMYEAPLDEREPLDAMTLVGGSRFWAEYRKTATVRAVQVDTPFFVETPEGVMEAEAGDYLCVGSFGDVWPIKKEIFFATYKPVSPNKA
jgi:hypothetical protein